MAPLCLVVVDRIQPPAYPPQVAPDVATGGDNGVERHLEKGVLTVVSLEQDAAQVAKQSLLLPELQAVPEKGIDVAKLGAAEFIALKGMRAAAVGGVGDLLAVHHFMFRLLPAPRRFFLLLCHGLLHRLA